MENSNIRDQVVDALETLSSPREQLEYEEALKETAGHAPTELISSFCDDLYHPKWQDFVDAFSEDELRELAHLYGLMVEVAPRIPPTVVGLLKSDEWRRVVELAQLILDDLRRHSHTTRPNQLTRVRPVKKL